MEVTVPREFYAGRRQNDSAWKQPAGRTGLTGFDMQEDQQKACCSICHELVLNKRVIWRVWKVLASSEVVADDGHARIANGDDLQELEYI